MLKIPLAMILLLINLLSMVRIRKNKHVLNTVKFTAISKLPQSSFYRNPSIIAPKVARTNSGSESSLLEPFHEDIVVYNFANLLF